MTKNKEVFSMFNLKHVQLRSNKLMPYCSTNPQRSAGPRRSATYSYRDAKTKKRTNGQGVSELDNMRSMGRVNLRPSADSSNESGSNDPYAFRGNMVSNLNAFYLIVNCITLFIRLYNNFFVFIPSSSSGQADIEKCPCIRHLTTKQLVASVQRQLLRPVSWNFNPSVLPNCFCELRWIETMRHPLNNIINQFKFSNSYKNINEIMSI